MAKQTAQSDEDAAYKLLKKQGEMVGTLNAGDYVEALSQGADVAALAVSSLEWTARELHVTVEDLLRMAAAKQGLQSSADVQAACLKIIGLE